MIRALYTAASGMMAQQLNLDNIANNLANASTTGFHSRLLQFQDLIYQNTVAPGAAATQQTTLPSGLQVGLGVRPASSEIIQTEGNFNATGNPLDMAIQGNGFFQVTLPTGDLAYTRSGAFHLDQNGNVVDEQGNSLTPNITIPSNALTVTVGTDGASHSGWKKIGEKHIRAGNPHFAKQLDARHSHRVRSPCEARAGQHCDS